jgi:ferredoxin
MNIALCCFSGTGNSLAVAKAIAGKIGGELISIPGMLERGECRIDAEIIGIVFPSYLAPLFGVPLIVERFLARLKCIESKHLFAVCTCGGYELVNALPTLGNLERMVAKFGGRLSAAYSLRLPMNNLDYDHIPVPIDTDQERIIARCDERLEDIGRRILAKRAEGHRMAKAIFNRMLAPLTDRSIVVNDSCDGCGTCAKVCLVENIEILEGRPVWRHRCEMCVACDEWCPKGAIRHWSRAEGIKYHHPSIGLKDMAAGSR